MASMQARYGQIATSAARQYGIPPRLFHALIAKESGWDPAAISPVGAIGLTQLMPQTAHGMGVNPHNPVENINGGARYLSNAYKHFGNWRDALRAYNQGWGGAASDKRAGADYANSILAHSKTINLPVFGIGRQPKRAQVQVPKPPGIGMLASAFSDDPAFAHLLRVINVPDHVVQQQGIVDPGGSVRHVPLPKGPVAGVIHAAQTQLGTPYVFGAEQANKAFDCSGLIQWAYGRMGIQLPRTTYDMVKVGKPVDPRRLAPGDLVFPEPGHVVMYVGHGKVIAAPHTGTVVQYQPLSQFRIWQARRIV